VLWRVVFGCAIAASGQPVAAAADKTGQPWGTLTPGALVRVQKVLDGDSFTTVSGDTVRLVSIQAPHLSFAKRPKFKPWAGAMHAKAALKRLISDTSVRLYYGGRKVDRYGRLLAHVRTPKGQWVQGLLLQAGHARVFSFSDNRKLLRRMLALEAKARANKRGIWKFDRYSVLTDLNANSKPHSFQIVTGKILTTMIRRRRVYLNFSREWRTDFTISMTRKTLRLFRKSGLDPAELEGKSIRIRGWIRMRNGPLIVVTHPEQIEILK
jgi:micrococcal nuclease